MYTYTTMLTEHYSPAFSRFTQKHNRNYFQSFTLVSSRRSKNTHTQFTYFCLRIYEIYFIIVYLIIWLSLSSQALSNFGYFQALCNMNWLYTYIQNKCLSLCLLYLGLTNYNNLTTKSKTFLFLHN